MEDTSAYFCDAMPAVQRSLAAVRLGRNAPAIFIYVVGPSSSGKTTLCDAIGRDPTIRPSVYIKEVARNEMRTHGFTRADVGTFKMQSAIMSAQLRAEMDAIAQEQSGCVIPKAPTKENASPVWCLSDRSAVDPVVYAMSSNAAGGGDMAARLRDNPEFKDSLSRYRKSLFVLLTPVPEWITDDGVRSLEDPWRYCDYLREELRELDISFREIGADVKDICARVHAVKEWVRILETEQASGDHQGGMT